MRKCILILGLLFFVSSLFAQRRTIEFNKEYLTARIYRPGKGTMQVRNMMLINDTLLQFSSTTSNGSIITKRLSTANIKFVKIKTGSYAAIGAAAGAGIGLLSSVYAILLVQNDPTVDDSNVNWTPVVIGFTAGGALIGTIAGLCIPKWKTYFLPDRETSYSIMFAPVVSPAYCGLGIKMKF